jgi:hypothetical protein
MPQMKRLKGLKLLVSNENRTGGCGRPGMFLKSRAGLLRPPLFESLNHEIGEGRMDAGAKRNKFFAFSPTLPLTRLRFII